MNLTLSFDIDTAQAAYGNYIDTGGPYAYADLAGNTETDWENVTWNDGRPKPSWLDLQTGWAAYLADYYTNNAVRGDVKQCYDSLVAQLALKADL